MSLYTKIKKSGFDFGEVKAFLSDDEYLILNKRDHLVSEISPVSGDKSISRSFFPKLVSPGS